MGTEFGRQQVLTIGHGVKVSADGQAQFKPIGISVDWTTVAAVGVDTNYQDGVLVSAGEKALRYGQVMTKITATGLYGPYDPAAADGRQLLVNGNVFIVNETTKENDLHSNHPPVIDGGRVWALRIINSGVAAHSLALGPTLAELLAVMPTLRPVNENPT